MLWISPLKLIGFRGQLAVPKPGVPPPFPYIQGSLVKMQKTTRINHPPDREFGGQFLAFFAQKSRKSLILTKNSSDRAIGFWVRANWNWFKKVQKIAQKRAIFSFFCRICKIPRPPPGKSEKTPKTHDNCPIKKSHFFGKNTKKVTFWGFFGKFMKIHQNSLILLRFDRKPIPVIKTELSHALHAPYRWVLFMWSRNAMGGVAQTTLSGGNFVNICLK